MATRRSLGVRVVVAIALMGLFFVAAVAAIYGLISVGLLILSVLGSMQGRGVLMVALAAGACFVAAGVVAWSVLPRPDRFEPPGPEITASAQPALFEQLLEVATATGEAMPVHVYLVNDVNAFVAQRGGLMGLGSRRVMGLGMPLLRALEVGELRAVIAHEMGHFYGGDTRLGPWVYKTRGSMIRTVVNLGNAGAQLGQIDGLVHLMFALVRAPFVWIAKGFLRVSQAVSRAQELSADAVAVRAEGARALVDGLKKTHAAAVAHALYLRNEVSPIADRGVLPPLGEGFSHFLRDPKVVELLDQVVDAEFAEGKADLYDSHPPLRERIAAVAPDASLVAPPIEVEPAGRDRPAIELIHDPEQYETAPVATEFSLRRISWQETGSTWIEIWRVRSKVLHDHKLGFTVAAVPHSAQALRELVNQVEDNVRGVRDQEIRGWAVGFLGSAISVALAEGGFSVENVPGTPHRLRRGEATIEPFRELAQLLDGELSTELWFHSWLVNQPMRSR